METDHSASPTARTAELLADLDATLLELRQRLDAFLERGLEDVVAADEGFRLAGLVYASSESAASHAHAVRTALEQAHSVTPPP